MPWHWEMGGQSKSIKSLDSGQGLGDPSPQGDPDNHQILLFKRWHVYKLFKPLSLFWPLWTAELLFAPYSWFITVFCEGVNWLASLSVLFWTGCGATLWYWSELTVYAFMSRRAREISTKSSRENMRDLAKKKSKLPPRWITKAVTGSNFEISEERDKANIF